jgi:hypothetical protein
MTFQASPWTKIAVPASVFHFQASPWSKIAVPASLRASRTLQRVPRRSFGSIDLSGTAIFVQKRVILCPHAAGTAIFVHIPDLFTSAQDAKTVH